MSGLEVVGGTPRPGGHVAGLPASLRWLDFVLGWPGGYFELLTGWPDGERERVWVQAHAERPCGEMELEHFVDLLEENNAEVEASLLRPQRGWGTCGAQSVLWVRLEGRQQADRLRRFRPVPTVVIREGQSTRYTAFWALSHMVRAHGDLLRWNKRLAHALGAPKKHADPDSFYFALPGTVLRLGRSRPCPVMLARCGIETYTVEDVVGRLRDAPDPDAWRDAPGNPKGRRA